MTSTKSILSGAAVLILLAVMYLLGASATRVGAVAPSAVSVAIATTTGVGPQLNMQLFSASNCGSRVITTVASPIMILFADPSNGDVSSTTLSALKGHLQAASTTIAYDSGIYGCGRVFAFGFASTTITTTETR